MSFNLQKMAEKTNGLTISTFGAFLWLTLLYLSMIDGDKCSLTKIATWLLTGLLAIGLIETGIFWMNKSRTIQADNLNTLPEKNIISGTAGITALSRVYINLISYPVLVLFLSGIFYLVIASNTGKPLVFCALSYSYLILMTFYIFIRKRLALTMHPWLQKVIGFINSQLPSYQIKDNQIHLDLKIKNVHRPDSRSLVSIELGELEEIKILNYPEARALLNYKIGPDLILASESVKDLYKYLKNEIPKPRYYSKVSSTGSILLLKGPEIFYLLSVANQDHQDLLGAFKRTKNL